LLNLNLVNTNNGHSASLLTLTAYLSVPHLNEREIYVKKSVKLKSNELMDVEWNVAEATRAVKAASTIIYASLLYIALLATQLNILIKAPEAARQQQQQQQ
jgi:hypothetical protein